MANYNVTMAQLQAAVMIPGGHTESNLDLKKQKGIKMTLVPGEGLWVELKGHKSLVPSTNIKVLWVQEPAPDLVEMNKKK